MLKSIITDYLQQHRRLVIPELGAFLKKEGGEVVFAPFLNKDDGVLSEKVRQIYGASSTEVEGIISKYVENVKDTVDVKGAYLLSPLGSLKRDQNGLLFLDAADMNPRPAPRQTVVQEVIVPQPEETVLLDPEAVVLDQPEIISRTEIPPAVEHPVQEPVNPVIQPLVRTVQPEQPAAQSPVTVIEPGPSVVVPSPISSTIPERPVAEQPVRRVQPEPAAPLPVRHVQPEQPPLQQPVRAAEPVRTPEPQILADTVDSPKTLNDLIRERQEKREAPKTVHTHMTEIKEVNKVPKKVIKPNSGVANRTAVAADSEEGKKGDIILILAVVVAVIAIGAMIYAYAVVDLPLFNLQ